MRISDWSSDVCSSDLCPFGISLGGGNHIERYRQVRVGNGRTLNFLGNLRTNSGLALLHQCSFLRLHSGAALQQRPSDAKDQRSEEHTSELQSLMRISYAVFCLKKKTETNTKT